MKPLNYLEIADLCKELNKISGTQLQRVSSDKDKIFLLFWDGKDSFIWIIDLRAKNPIMLPFRGNIPRKNIKKPWISFLEMHFSGSIFTNVSPQSVGERSISLQFKNIEKGEQEIIINLFPKGVNLILKSEAKQVSKFKLKEFSPLLQVPRDLPVRTLEQLQLEYGQLGEAKALKSQLNPEQLWEKEVLKVKKSINKISEELGKKKIKITELKALGEFIKENQSLEVPTSLSKYIQEDLSVMENMTLAFHKYKKEKLKIDGTSERLTVLQDELKALDGVKDYSHWVKANDGSVSDVLKIKKNQKLKFKTIVLQNDFKVLLGASAKNNSELIKASKPWYLWMHLRDYSSSHAVIVCKKNEEVSRDILIKAGQELVKYNFKSKKIKYESLKFDIIYCQIRYLRQIKGAPGKVTYTNDKNINIQM